MIRILILSLFLLIPSVRAGVNILVLGSSESFDKREQPEAHEVDLDISELASTLQFVLNRGKAGKNGTTVFFEDIFRKKSVPTALGSAGTISPADFQCHSLAQYYFWPEGREERLANLSNKGETKWDYVILVGDPYLISEMPGIYAEGVNLLVNKIKEGEAKIILLMPWHSEKGKTSRIVEVVNRVGQGLDIPVAPAGDTWARAGSSLSVESGEYMAAASVFSAVSGGLAWSSSSSQKSLAKKSLATVNENKAMVSYSELFNIPNPFAMKAIGKEKVTFNQTGSSSEAGIKVGMMDAFKRCGIAAQEVRGETAKVDFNYGRGNSGFEAEKRYKVKPDQFDRSYGFAMQDQAGTAAESMLYGIDKRYFNMTSYDDGTDLGIAYDMIKDGEVKDDIRAIPIRLMWAKLQDANPKLTPLRDKWHMSRILDASSGAFIVTLLTSQNPVGEEPADKESNEWNLWLGRKVGYETAMRMGQLKLDPVKN